MTVVKMRGPSRRSASLVVGAVALLIFFGAGPAVAATAPGAAAGPGNATNPLLGGVDAVDSSGVPLVSYQHLPLDRGDALDSHATMTAWLTDAAWTAHVGMVALALQLLEWVLSFAWIDWVLGPLDALRRSLGEQLGGFAWAPLALLITAIVGGILAFRGRLGAGVMQLVVSAACFGLATTLMLAPLTAITGSEHPVDDARGLGQALASAVVDDVLADEPGSGDDGAPGSAGADSMAQLETELVTLFVRGAAQEVAFGAALDETACGDVYTDAMLAEAPGPERSGVRDAVADCSESAAAYVEQPSLWQPFSVMITMTGAIAMLGLVVVLAMALLGAVLQTVIASLRAMVWVNVAILPGIGRQRFVRAIADAGASLIAIVVLIIAVAGSSSLIVNVAGHVSRSGTSLTVQMACVTGITIACAIAIATVGRRLRAGGRNAADAFRSFVGGGIDAPRRAERPTPTVVRAPRAVTDGAHALPPSGSVPRGSPPSPSTPGPLSLRASPTGESPPTASRASARSSPPAAGRTT